MARVRGAWNTLRERPKCVRHLEAVRDMPLVQQMLCKPRFA
ncbi:MAG: hypothetical protein ACJ8G7_18075 [Rhizobacter sp.]